MKETVTRLRLRAVSLETVDFEAVEVDEHGDDVIVGEFIFVARVGRFPHPAEDGPPYGTGDAALDREIDDRGREELARLAGVLASLASRRERHEWAFGQDQAIDVLRRRGRAA